MTIQKTTAKLPIVGEVRIDLHDKAGNLKVRQIIKNTFMAVGDAHVADQLSDQGEAQMGWLAIGTSSTAKAAANTTLNSESDRNPLAGGYPEQQAAGDDNDVKYKATWAAGDGTGALTEAGVFNSSVTDAGTMLCAATFSVINKGAADTLTIVWTVTVGAS